VNDSINQPRVQQKYFQMLVLSKVWT